jgi:hypothetical protein
MSNRLTDIFLTYQFLKRLTTPFDKWEAYKLGIIDADGKVLKKRKDLQTLEEKGAWGYFDILTANLKKLIMKIPGGQSRIATFAAALLLLREHRHATINSQELLEEKFKECYALAEARMTEEGEGGLPANNVGGGKVAGLGVGAQGEPAGKIKTKNKMLKRKVIDVDAKYNP